MTLNLENNNINVYKSRLQLIQTLRLGLWYASGKSPFLVILKVESQKSLKGWSNTTVYYCTDKNMMMRKDNHGHYVYYIY